MGRRGNGVEVRGNSIRVQFVHDGVPQRHTLRLNGHPLPPTKANVQYANRLVVEINEKIRHRIFSPSEYFPADGNPGATTVATQLDTWLACVQGTKSSKDSYKSACRFWKAAVGDKALRALVQSDILRAVVARTDPDVTDKPLSGKTVNNYMMCIRLALDLAVTDKLIDSNPADGIPAAAYQTPEPDPFTEDEMERIIAKAKERYPGHVGNMVEAWFWTGMRTSEIFGLRWGRVELPMGRITVSEGVVAGVRTKSTKTSVARTVLLHDRAKGAFARQAALTRLAGEAVFQDPRYDQDWYSVQMFIKTFWNPILKALGIRVRRPYDIRHTCATLMLMRGMKPAFCAGQLGHSVEVFLRTYAKKWINGPRDALEMELFNLDSSLIHPQDSEKSNTSL